VADQPKLSPRFDLDLPVLAHAEEILEAVQTHSIVVICGETGSGKSTQLPKLMLELGRGTEHMIGHTQPRRIAARSLASRVAEECGTRVGEGVGYRVRFNDRTSAQTQIKLLTDGMLLAETQRDPDLRQYDTLIIDEAHERSLNIDFLLGYLKRLIARRSDLRIIITSATIDPQRFAEHFDEAPIIEVSGRTYPVEMRYRPLAAQSEDERERSLRQGVLEAVDELSGLGRGDVLVFLPGEREIRQCAEALRKHQPAHTEVLPLFGRLSAAEQQRVFAAHRGRRIILATNVAETSLTVPGIRYVIDSGLARISRYSYRTKVQRLPIEPIARSSADQRAGRCGREGPGVCIRLFDQADYEARPRFTDPEILRTNLASVILQMKHLRLGPIEAFPFIEPPDPRYVRDGLKLLDELGALNRREKLSALGRQLARLPVDPRIGRILLAGAKEHALSELVIIAAALSIQDPRERPMDQRERADAAQKPWQDRQSDFAGLLRLWEAYQEQSRTLSRRKLQDWCREHFLSYVRMREWRDVQTQLHGLVKGMGLEENATPAQSIAIHRALLTGFLSNIARRETASEYIGPRGLKLAIHPGSGPAAKRPRWIMAAELVETTRVFARATAEVRPEWIEPLAPHLLKHRYHDPWWEAQKGKVFGREDVTLYGLPIVSGRKIDYARVEPAQARQVFIEEGLLGELPVDPPDFLLANQALIESVEALEAKTRRRDVLVDKEALTAFYEAALPAQVIDGPSLSRWLKAGGDDTPLRLQRDQLMARGAGLSVDAYPDYLELNGVELPLTYQFEPGHGADGVSVRIPIAALNALEPEPFEWLVPGMLEDKVITLIRALPKSLRRNFVPVPDFAAAVLEALPARAGSLEAAVQQELRRMTGIDLPAGIWDAAPLPAHLRMHFQIVSSEGETLDQGRDLPALQRALSTRAAENFEDRADSGFERVGLTDWDIGTLPERLAFVQGGVTLQGYPALCAESDQVALRLLDSADRAKAAHRAGVRALLMKRFAQQARFLRRGLEGLDRIAIDYRDVDRAAAFKREFAAAVFDQVFLSEGLPYSREAWLECCQQGREQLIEAAERLRDHVSAILRRQVVVRRVLNGNVPMGLMDSYQDMREQLNGLIYPGFLLETPTDRLTELPRYLEAMEKRLERLERDPNQDQAGLALIKPHQRRLQETLSRHQQKAIRDPALNQIRWMLEEYRVSLFAQALGTRERVSEKRLGEVWATLR
jgi:ATP-dependent helicase HrpA